MMNKINLQNQGYGFFKYNPSLTNEQNTNLYENIIKTIGIIFPGCQLVINKYNLLIIIISVFSCSSIKGQQKK